MPIRDVTGQPTFDFRTTAGAGATPRGEAMKVAAKAVTYVLEHQMRPDRYREAYVFSDREIADIQIQLTPALAKQFKSWVMAGHRALKKARALEGDDVSQATQTKVNTSQWLRHLSDLVWLNGFNKGAQVRVTDTTVVVDSQRPNVLWVKTVLQAEPGFSLPEGLVPTLNSWTGWRKTSIGWKLAQAEIETP